MLSKKYIDLTLRPNNAKEKGYAYVDDIVYRDDMQNGVINDVIELIKNEKCKLGIAQNNDLPGFFGLYRPLNIKK